MRAINSSCDIIFFDIKDFQKYTENFMSLHEVNFSRGLRYASLIKAVILIDMKQIKMRSKAFNRME